MLGQDKSQLKISLGWPLNMAVDLANFVVLKVQRSLNFLNLSEDLVIFKHNDIVERLCYMTD